MQRNPLVSIWCITYNHELYIRDAIESFLAQKTNFQYEIIIHDDASSDRTAEIIKEYEKKYPDLIHSIFQEKNQYSKNQPNTKWLWDIMIQSCKGKYIAFCEGDDYWIDVQKLQLQTEYLESHPECSMAVHDAVSINYEKGYEVKAGGFYSMDRTLPPKDVIKQKVIIRTASMLCRKEHLTMESFFYEPGIGDYPLLLYCLTKGTIYYFSRIMSVYRWGHRGSWTYSMQDVKIHTIQEVRSIDFLNKYRKYCNSKYECTIVTKICALVDGVMGMWSKNGIKNIRNFCSECDLQTEKKYHNIFDRIEKVWMQIYDENYLAEEIIKFAKEYKKIAIMGAGKYAKILAEKFAFNGVKFEGFIVSNGQHSAKEYLGKPVWKFKDIPIELKDVGIVIGINPVIWDEIVDELENGKVENYICPFLI